MNNQTNQTQFINSIMIVKASNLEIFEDDEPKDDPEKIIASNTIKTEDIKSVPEKTKL